jgi:hypothetical protein
MAPSAGKAVTVRKFNPGIMGWRPPVVPAGSVVEDFHDFWLEATTTPIGSALYIDGCLMHGVTEVTTTQDVGSTTNVTVTFRVRTLNKGEHPDK